MTAVHDVPPRTFFAWMALPATILLVVMGWSAYVHTTGTEILLETAPVDPRDLFRGNYMDLSYRISTLDRERFVHGGPTPGGEAWQGGDTIYVVLFPEDPYHVAGFVVRDRTMLSGDETCIKGRVSSATNDVLRIEYGIESYFFEEGAGFPDRAEKVDVLVALDPFCNAQIKALYVDGERWP